MQKQIISTFAVILLLLGLLQALDIYKFSKIDQHLEKIESNQHELAVKVAAEFNSEPDYVSLGDFKVTHYCSCERCCGKTDGITKSGTKATEGRTIGVDPNKIALGTKVVINGHEYVAEDTGCMKGNRIDIYVGSHQEALEKGVYVAEVFTY